VQLYRTARRAEELVGPLLHVGIGLDMVRFEREQALQAAVVAAVLANYSPAEVATASGLPHRWLLDRRRPV
jgi:hypothetical protein